MNLRGHSRFPIESSSTNTIRLLEVESTALVFLLPDFIVSLVDLHLINRTFRPTKYMFRELPTN